jgi:hypothetical protein
MSRALVLLLVLASCKDDAPAPPATASAGKVVEVTGKVTDNGAALKAGDAVREADVIDTGTDGHCVIELAHNQARWELGPNKHQKVSESIAWTLPKQEATKPIDQNTAAAGRNAERSAADSTSTTTPAPGAAATNAAPPPTNAPDSAGPAPAARNDSAAAGGGAAPPKSTPPKATAKEPPAPPMAAQAPSIGAKDAFTDDAKKTDEKAAVRTRGGAVKGDVATGQGASKPEPLADKGPTGKTAHDVLADASFALAKCLAVGQRLKLTVKVAANGKPTIAIDASETPSAAARTCLDGKVKKLAFPSVATEVSIDLQR